MNQIDRRSVLRSAIFGAAALTQAQPVAHAQCNCETAADGTPLDSRGSEIRPMIERYEVDQWDINRVYGVPGAALKRTKLDDFYTSQARLMDGFGFNSLSQSGKVDYLLLRNRLEHDRAELVAEAKHEQEMAPLIPFQQSLAGLEQARRHMDTIDAEKTASALHQATAEIADARKSSLDGKPGPVLQRAAQRLSQLRGTLRHWFQFYDLYDPQFSWWVDVEYKKLDEALDSYAQALHAASGMPGALEGGPTSTASAPAAPAARKGPAPGSNEELSGAGPAGRAALIEALRNAIIAYTPEELIAIANREFAWCDREMLRASGEMGCGSDWKKALEQVKNHYAQPGKMIYLVRDLERDAIAFIKQHDLVTIPPMVEADYWEEAMTPQMQLVNPFFTGGQTIQVPSPANSQTIDQRMEVMRGNNEAMSRDTVFHELIPGHHMQFYMAQRYRTYRGMFSTPFWTEGMAFYWEMLLWDLGYTHTPEQRVGALFWRMHRCARIIFSLNFHLGKMSAVDCVQFLVDRVGFERGNAEGEVRRSFQGNYPPIYQCAYMVGALQFYALHKELVGSGKMSQRAFHDSLYREGNIPVEMLRAAITGQAVRRDQEASWKFYGPVAA